MKVAVVGKGGSGKTTAAAVLARTLARRGEEVVALDCDANANLGLSLGIGEEETERLISIRQAVDAGEEAHATAPDDLLARFGTDGPDGVRLAVVHRIDNPVSGCPCCGLNAEHLLGTVETTGRTVVADFEAGIGTLTRMGEGHVDSVLVLVEPNPKSIEVGVRAAALAAERGVGDVLIVANRVHDDADRERIRDAFPGARIVEVPDDPAIVAADREGVAPLDHDPDSGGVRALGELADRIGPG
jgi:CO dehydrogenase maturation factor